MRCIIGDFWDTSSRGAVDRPETLQQRAKSIGFQGKFAIHPTQVKDIDILFTPSEGEINYAKRVITAFEEAEVKGRGSTSLDGKMIDVPVVRRARALLLRAESTE